MGHNFFLFHPTPGTNDGNIMHQGVQPNGGMKVSAEQVKEMKNNYSVDKCLNTGKQKL